MPIKIVENSITKAELEILAKEVFGDYVKAVVDIERKIAAFGGEMHADEEGELLHRGSEQRNLWGINIYPDMSREEWIAYDSMINIRPRDGNPSRGVESEELRGRIKEVIEGLIK